jgi:gamma-glutamyltranspeptidase / glutathione hydrolase
VPSTRGSQSRADPAHPSGLAPGKRPRLTPNPVMAIRDDGSVLTFGCPGGDMQCQALLQVFLGVFHFGMDLQEAIDAPRFSTWSFPNSFAPHDYLAGHFMLEDRFPDGLAEEMERRGHHVQHWPEFTREAAAVEAIYADARRGFLRAGADPRQPAYAIVG